MTAPTKEEIRAVLKSLNARRIDPDAIDAATTLVRELAAMVKCPHCHGYGGDGIKSSFERPCFEDPQETTSCDRYGPAECTHKEVGKKWGSCTSGGLSELLFVPCKPCSGTGCPHHELEKPK